MKKQSIPITILTGFLGSGKTTLINKIIEENKEKKFGLIINEYGEINIDSQLISTDVKDSELYEMTNGCICCVVRGDLIEAVETLISNNKLDYILIETSGLADPLPVAQTFMAEDLGGRVHLDGVITLVDGINYFSNNEDYFVAISQIISANIIVLNKAQEISEDQVEGIIKDIKHINEHAFVIVNKGDLDTKHLVQSDSWSFGQLSEQKVQSYDEVSEKHNVHEVTNISSDKRDSKDFRHHEHDGNCNCDHDSCSCSSSEGVTCGSCSCNSHDDEHHNHVHDDVDQLVFTTNKILDIKKFDEWVAVKIPQEVIRAKGFLRLNYKDYDYYLFQMVGSRKQVVPFAGREYTANLERSRIVFLGKNLPKNEIISAMKSMETE